MSNPAPLQSAENSTIREMRAQIDNLNTALKQAEADRDTAKTALTEKERQEMAEIDRLKAEKADTEAKLKEALEKANQVEGYQTMLKEEYENLLASAPPDKLEVLKQISQHGDWPERLRSLKAGLSLSGTAAPTPQVHGTITQPSNAQPPPAVPAAPQPSTPEYDLSKGKPPSWGAALKQPGQAQT